MRNLKRVIPFMVVPILLGVSSTATAEDLLFKDPSGDDKGTGKIVYPTSKDYKRGSFDLVELAIEDKGSTVEVVAEFATKIEDPWDSKSWSGNGFSLQFVQVYLDLDKKAGSGHKDALPGMNVEFKEDARWERVLLISPQPSNRLKSEVDSKAAKMKRDIVFPSNVRVSGKKLKATFSKAETGLKKGAGVQALVQSNEGYPTKEDLLTRKVNEYEGEHRFGGGNDHDCDPHVLDMLAGQANGDGAEAKAQYGELSAYVCNPDGSGKKAEVGMVYR
jgi:carbohydrate-binding DOMON domain-containing protein